MDNIPNKRGYNSFSIIGFVLSVVFTLIPLLGVVYYSSHGEGLEGISLAGIVMLFGFVGSLLGILSYLQIRKSKERGLLLSILAVLFGIFFVTFPFWFFAY